jgi:hypothetical protein
MCHETPLPRFFNSREASHSASGTCTLSWNNMGFCSMKRYFQKFTSTNMASVFRQHRPSRVLPTITCIGLLSALLAACGGSSGSDAPSVSQITDTMQVQPTPSPPQTGGNTSYHLGNTSQIVIDQCMSEDDKQMLTQVNTARSQYRNWAARITRPLLPLVGNAHWKLLHIRTAGIWVTTSFLATLDLMA